MKKLLIALFVAVLAVSAGASSGNKSAQTPKVPDWPIAFPTAKNDPNPIKVTPTFTPFFRIENEERVIDMRLNERDMNNAKHWLCVDILFYTFPPPQGRRWSQWLDDVTVEVNVFLPLGDGKGKVVSCGVLGGKQTLASLKVFDIPNQDATEKDRKQHFVRMMIPPEVIYRYFAIKGTGKENYLDFSKDYQKISDELGKFARDLPIMVSISSSGRTLYAYQECGKSIYASLQGNGSSSVKLFAALLKGEDDNPSLASTKKMFNYVNQNKFNPQTFKYMPDELLPVSKTPFAWVLFDRFEAIKETSGK